MSDVVENGQSSKEQEIADLKARLALLEQDKKVDETAKVQAAEALLTREQVSPAAAARKGRRFEVDPAPARVGEVVQLFGQLPAGATIEDIEVSEGFEIVRVMLGIKQFPTADGAGTWRDAIGKVVPPAAFTMALVQNKTGGPAVAEGAFWLSGTDAVPAPIMQPIVQPGPVPVQHVPAAQIVAAHAVAPPPPPRQSRTVTPGNNEVAVLMQRSECMRLLQALSGGLAISDTERPSILRQLQASLERV